MWFSHVLLNLNVPNAIGWKGASEMRKKKSDLPISFQHRKIKVFSMQISSNSLNTKWTAGIFGRFVGVCRSRTNKKEKERESIWSKRIHVARRFDREKLCPAEVDYKIYLESLLRIKLFAANSFQDVRTRWMDERTEECRGAWGQTEAFFFGWKYLNSQFTIFFYVIYSTCLSSFVFSLCSFYFAIYREGRKTAHMVTWLIAVIAIFDCDQGQMTINTCFQMAVPFLHQRVEKVWQVIWN